MTATLKTKEIMDALRVSRPTVTKLIHDGRLDGYKIGKAGPTSDWRITKESFDAYLRDLKQRHVE